MGPWLIVVGVGAATVVALLAGPGIPPAVGRGSPAPAFELRRLRDDSLVALDALRGRVVLINFWATWCKPCEDEMPAMERLYQALRDDGLELLAVSVDADREEVARFQRRLQLSFPILLDPDQKVARAYQTFRYPESLLVGPDGAVLERFVGPKAWDAASYVERIRRLLATGLPSQPARSRAPGGRSWG